jgi:hypothetical protein
VTRLLHSRRGESLCALTATVRRLILGTEFQEVL